MDPVTEAPVEAVAAPVAAAEPTPAQPTTLAAAFAAASEKSGKAKAAAAAPAAAPEPVKAAAPAKADPPAKAAPAKADAPPKAKAEAKADPLDAAAAEVDDPNFTKLPFDDIEDDSSPDDDEPKTTDERVGRRIEILKNEIKATWKPKVAELEETVKQRDARLAELEAFAKERDELLEAKKSWEAEMSVTKLEKTPAFIKEVAEPEAKVVGDTLKIIEHYGLDEKAIFAALEEPDAMKRSAALKAATSGLDVDPDHHYELRKLADDAQKIIARRAELYENADAALAELSAKAEKETAAQLAARAEERVKATDLVVDRIAKKLPFIADIIKDVVDTTKETNFEALDPQKQAYNVLMGEAGPKIAVALAKVTAERDRLLDEVASFTKASPRVDGGLAKTGPGGAQPRSLAEAAAMAAGAP